MQNIPIKSLRNSPGNPRKIEPDKLERLKKSLRDFPEMLNLRPLVVKAADGGKYEVLGGNMRLRALKELGYKEVPCTIADGLTGEQEREFMIKDNLGFGDWDFDALRADWNAEELADWGLDLPDLEQNREAGPEEDDFDEAPPVMPITVLGDLYEIGEHRLLCGDSTQADTFTKLMQGEMADAVITDPPYNVAYEGGTKDRLTIQNDSMGDDEFYKFLYDFYTALSIVCKKGAAIYVWHTSSEIINFAKAMVDAGWLLKQQLIWVKNSMVIWRQDYQWKHEPCLYGWLNGGSHKWYSDRKQTTVIEFDKPLRNGEHPTMKPVGLFAYQIKNSSKKGDVIVDAFGGSGTTMVACHQTSRKARLIEYDPKYCDVIVRRMLKLDPSLIVKRNGVDCKSDFE